MAPKIMSSRLQLNLTHSDDGIARLFPISFSQRRRHPLPRLVQSFRQNPRLAHDRHEVSVGNPAGEDVHVDVSGDASAGGFAYIHTEVDAIGLVEVAQGGL